MIMIKCKNSTILAFLFGCLIIIKLPYILLRIHPTLFYDESMYLYKAKVIFKYITFSSNDILNDIRSVYMPLYSVVLSLAGFIESPSVNYQFSLVINAIILSSIIYPSIKIYEHSFKSNKFSVLFLIGIWTIPFCYSFSIMSEALFVPLFIWFGYFYTLYFKNQSFKNTLYLCVVLSCLVMTRQAGILLLPAMIIVLALHYQNRISIVTYRILIKRSPIILVPLFFWLSFKVFGWDTGNKQTIGNYFENGIMAVFTSPDAILAYVRMWVGQLMYLNIATFFLFGVLILQVFCSKKQREIERESTLIPVGYFVVIVSFFMIFPGTIHMFKSQVVLGSEHLRYYMYGRYTDMIVPYIVLYSLGYILQYKSKKRLFYLCILCVFGSVICFVLLFHSTRRGRDSNIKYGGGPI